MQVVQHNLTAQFANRQLGITTSNKAKTTEKLSSGYRINRSADDAAGLSISEKMRWQIRGLDKGSDNITAGISLIQTAEGALNEVHSILQRIRELSVQALNDTNTEDDRHAIQKEVDASLEEIDSIRDTTMFNTKPLLQGNPTETIRVSEDSWQDATVTALVRKTAPSWLVNSTEMKAGNATGLTQEKTAQEVMLKSDLQDNGDGTKSIVNPRYYGKESEELNGAGYTWKGEWTTTINDNPSAKMDFGTVAAQTSAEGLYNTMYELLGTKVSFPCGTCNREMSSISFGGEMDGTKIIDFQSNAQVDWSGQLNLTETSFTYQGKEYKGYVEAINDLWDKYAANYATDSGVEKDPDAEAAAARNLGDAIARDIRDKSVAILDEKMPKTHFDRVQEGRDDYSLVVYDFRDKSVLDREFSAGDYTAMITTKSIAKTTMPVSTLVPGMVVDAESPMKIMCGALSSSYISLQLPDVSLSGLNLTGYSVDRYQERSYYSDEYKKKVQAWESTGHEESYTVSGTRKVKEFVSQTPAEYGTIYDAGEPQRVVLTPAKNEYREHEESYSYTSTVFVHDLPYPEPGEGDVIRERLYDPSSLWLVDWAIRDISEARTMLGAQQNRLEYAYNINNNSSENTSAAESRLRDADMASEMVAFSKHSILEQAGQSMLSQANQQTQGVMALLQ